MVVKVLAPRGLERAKALKIMARMLLPLRRLRNARRDPSSILHSSDTSLDSRVALPENHRPEMVSSHSRSTTGMERRGVYALFALSLCAGAFADRLGQAGVQLSLRLLAPSP